MIFEKNRSSSIICCFLSKSDGVHQAELLPNMIEQSDELYTDSQERSHLQQFSHDTINRYWSGELASRRRLWNNVKPLISSDTTG